MLRFNNQINLTVKGVVGYSKEHFLNNTGPGYLDGENFFSVLGVFFPMSCGVLAGFQMAGDVKNPPKDIPKGSLAAVLVRYDKTCTGKRF